MVIERMRKIRRALFIGRFQPFHRGHLKAVEDIVKKSEELIIAIGSAQYSYEPNNPFTSGERLVMIRLALNEAKIDPARYLIVPLPDIHRPLMWVTWTVSFVGHFDIVFSNGPVTARVFKEEGYEVKSIPAYNQKLYSGSEIRKRMRTDEKWRQLVPKSVASYIDSIDGVNRLKDMGEVTIPEDDDAHNSHLRF
jgi:nicotinamide-nucleotide adenylyltransferase